MESNMNDPTTTMDLKVNPTAVAMLEEWLEHAKSGELQHVVLKGEYPYGQSREQDSRTVTFEVEGMKTPAETWQSRLREEHTQLQTRSHALTEFLGTSEFGALPAEDRRLLEAQAEAMVEYGLYLAKRVGRLA